MTPETAVDEFYKHIKKYKKDSSYEFIKLCIDACPSFDALTYNRIPPLLYAMVKTYNVNIVQLLAQTTKVNYNYKVLHEYFICTPYDLFTHIAQSHCEKHYRNLNECPTCKYAFGYDAHFDVQFLIYMNIYNVLSIYYHRALGTIGYIDKQCIYEYQAQGYIDPCDFLEFPNEKYMDIELYNYVRNCCFILNIDLEFIAIRTLDFPPDMNDYDTYDTIPNILKF